MSDMVEVPRELLEDFMRVTDMADYRMTDDDWAVYRRVQTDLRALLHPEEKVWVRALSR